MIIRQLGVERTYPTHGQRATCDTCEGEIAWNESCRGWIHVNIETPSTHEAKPQQHKRRDCIPMNCGTCKFFESRRERCRRYPQELVKFHSDWCGEWQVKT